jgi:hypothetical protein
MGSTKLTMPLKMKATFLKPCEIPEATLESDSEESENDNSEKNYEQPGIDQSLFQQVQAPSQSGYTGFKC